eukprot:TRINITY_DN27414_c0_g1_i1.p1 TRINITY_DN27414_c0_g1~~TRINITY_DN27414_c0_g1_i1.p1  ORF type:complete len:146 (-),score=14.50 TRINITY_DN27414_c0_g1_i1:9-446(-)
MTRKLASGIFAYASCIQDLGLPCSVCEVGAAMEAVHDRDYELWSTLGQPDGFHPKPLGSFLAACVFARAIAYHPMYSHRFSGLRIETTWPTSTTPCGPKVEDDPEHSEPGSVPESAAPRNGLPTEEMIVSVLKTVGGFAEHMDRC